MKSHRVAIYARVSTAEQDTSNQLRELRALVKRRKGWVAGGEYVDQGVSGAKDRRPALDRLVADARRRKVDVILVWALDRLGRSLRHLVLLADELGHLGVDLVCLTQPIDTTTPTGRFTFSVLAAVAEFERELIRERVLAGLARARASGAKLGRPRAQLDLARARQLLARGLSQRAVARQLGAAQATLRRQLAR
jgi:DNA invertase Pin-like site-specific DNA recombinase